jgi:ABC-type nickel/cobalt efflux system permease component RcnA
MRFRLRVLASVAAVGIGVLAAAALQGARTAAAHPLGNFTINHYDRVTVSDTAIEVYNVLDMAEIPTFRERQQIDVNGDGMVDAPEAEAYASQKVDEIASNLRLRAGDEDLLLVATSHEITFPPGQGGLSLLRLTATYRATAPASRDMRRVAFEDNNYADRLGWREIVVRPGGNVQIDGASAFAQDRSAELTAYPQGALSSPLDVRSAAFSYMAAPGAVGEAPPQPQPVAVAVRGNPDGALARFAGLIAKEHLSAGVIALALLAAAGFGAIHALSPGHGKTIVAAYLVGSKGTARHAVALGMTVTLTHTSSVYALGFITLYLSDYVVPERLYPWLTLVSGLLIVAMGLALLIGRARSAGFIDGAAAWVKLRLRPEAAGTASTRLAFAVANIGPTDTSGELAGKGTYSDHSEAHGSDDGHAHAHNGNAGHNAVGSVALESAHRHGPGRAHTHGIAGDDGEPVTWRRLLGLGIFGGMLPCPSAIVVMLSAISLHRVGFGLLLIVAFSLGLAGVLTGIGFALVYGRGIIDRVPVLRSLLSGSRATQGVAALAVRAFPVASAAAVFVAGLVVMYPALGKI